MEVVEREEQGSLFEEEGAVEVEELEVAGVIRDKKGQTWAVPAGNVEDLNDLFMSDSAYIPNPEPGFQYCTCPDKRLAEFRLKGWREVSQSEIGVPLIEKDQYGAPIDTLHRVGMDVLMKMPTVLWERQQAIKAKKAQAELDVMEPSADAVRKATERGFPAKAEMKRSRGQVPEREAR